MKLWCKAHHVWFVCIALVVAIIAELFFGGLLIGMPAFVYADTNLVLSLIAAMPLIVAISICFDGNEPDVGVPVRNTVLLDYAAFAIIVLTLVAVGFAAIPLIGYAGICSALAVLGCGALGVVCSRLFGRKTGGAIGPVYIVVCCAVGTPPMRDPAAWQFPLAVTPTLVQFLVVLALVVVMLWTPPHPERRIA